MKKILIILTSYLMISTSHADDVSKQVSEYISNIIPGEGDTEVSIDIRENFKPDYSILGVREIEKTALGLNHNIVAFKNMNTTYIEGEEFINMKTKDFSKKILIKYWKLKVLIFDILCKLKIMKSLILAAVIFKEKPTKKLKKNMRENGWKFSNLPKNPYL